MEGGIGEIIRDIDPVRNHSLEHESAMVTLERPASNGIESGATGNEKYEEGD